MRRVLFAGFLVVAGLFAIATAGAPVLARSRAPSLAAPADLYCLQGKIWGYPGNCQFATYGQCMATASGTNAYCGVNPLHAFARQRRAY